MIFVSATPGPYERAHVRAGRRAGRAADRARRSRGRDAARSRRRSTTCCPRSPLRVARDERVLVTTLTKRMAEDLTEYLHEHGVRVRYLHSDIETVERVEIIRDLRLGKFDVLVGINLLREGLDMPEVSLVAILDADKEGFLRSEGSLIQTIGRAARHVQRPGDPVCGPGDGLDQARDRRDEPAPRQAARVQRRARHHAAVDPQGGDRHHGGRARGRAGRAAGRRKPARLDAGAGE